MILLIMMQAIRRVNFCDVVNSKDAVLSVDCSSTQGKEADFDDHNGCQESLAEDFWEDELDAWNVIGETESSLKRPRTVSVDSGCLDVDQTLLHDIAGDVCGDIGELSDLEDEIDDFEFVDDEEHLGHTSSLVGLLINMSRNNISRSYNQFYLDADTEIVNDESVGEESAIGNHTSDISDMKLSEVLDSSGSPEDNFDSCTIGNKGCTFDNPEFIFGRNTNSLLDESDIEQLLHLPEFDEDNLEFEECRGCLLVNEVPLESTSIDDDDDDDGLARSGGARRRGIQRLLTDDSGFGEMSYRTDGSEDEEKDELNQEKGDRNVDEDDVEPNGKLFEERANKLKRKNGVARMPRGPWIIPRISSRNSLLHRENESETDQNESESNQDKSETNQSESGQNESECNQSESDTDDLDDLITPYYCPPPVRRRRDSGVSLSGDQDVVSNLLVRKVSVCEAACSDCLSWYNPEQATDEETSIALHVLCAERLTQMTKTYNDIEAVTRLLEEKERDLELAARIGTTLLEKNKELSARNEELEDQISEANEKVSQLKHEVAMKDALLQVYIQDYDNASPSPVSETTTFGLPISGFDNLQKKVKALEEENKDLRQETFQLQCDTDTLEEREAALVTDILHQYTDCKDRLTDLEDDVLKKGEINLRLQEDKTKLQTEIIDLEARIRKLTAEHMEVSAHLKAAQFSQRELTTEVGELTDKYHECMGLLHEAQEEVKALRRKAKPNVVHQHIGMMSPFHPEGSLAFELEDTMKKEISYPDGYSPHDRKMHNRRIMETAKVVKKSNRKSSSLLSIFGSTPSSNGNDSCESIAGSSNRSSLYLSDPESSIMSESGDFNSLFGTGSLGKPGIPGSNDLETALRRLSIRKANEINEKILEEEEEKTLNKSARGLDMFATPATGSHTPDSLLSLGSDFSKFSGYSGLNFHIPEKLQIVKPMEGSMTLHQWQRLATPHLGCFMDQRPGVQNKGERPLDIDEEVYDMSDLEEDSPDDFITPNKVERTFGTYTYTMSKIMHPTLDNDNTIMTQVYQGGPRLSSTMGAFSSRDAHTTFGTTTFSMSSSLARVLQERENEEEEVEDKPNKQEVTPPRFHSIVTETLSECRHSQTEAIYSSANMMSPQFLGIGSHTALAMIMTDSKMLRKDLHRLMGSPKKVKQKDVELLLPIDPDTPLYIDGISDTAQPMVVSDSFNLVKKLKNSGLENAGSTTAAQAVLDTGLNSIMSFAGSNVTARVHQATPSLTSPCSTSSSDATSPESHSKRKDSHSELFSNTNKVSVSSLSEPLLRHLAGLQNLGSGILGVWRGSETKSKSTSDLDTSKQVESSL